LHFVANKIQTAEGTLLLLSCETQASNAFVSVSYDFQWSHVLLLYEKRYYNDRDSIPFDVLSVFPSIRKDEDCL
jgi:hypothetical protein